MKLKIKNEPLITERSGKNESEIKEMNNCIRVDRLESKHCIYDMYS